MKVSTTTYSSSTLSANLTADGTDTGTACGVLNAYINGQAPSFSISVALSRNVSADAAIIQKQLTDFISDVRTTAKTNGIEAFAEPTTTTA